MKYRNLICFSKITTKQEIKQTALITVEKGNLSLTIEPFQGRNGVAELYKKSESSIKAVSTSEETEKIHLLGNSESEVLESIQTCSKMSRYPEKIHVKDWSTEQHV